MKKFFLFAASVMMLATFVSCNNNGGGKDDPKKAEVQTAKENLVAHFGFDEKEVPGAGIAFVENKGAASISSKGFIGNGWTNTTGNNLSQAYTKYSLASSSALSGLKDITFTAWVKLIENCSKGAILSINGMPSGFDWPLFIAYFDNTGSDADTGAKTQQVNGRLAWNAATPDEMNLWLDTFDAAFAKYDTWFQFAFTYEASSGNWALYADGIKVKEATSDSRFDFNKLIASASNAIYVGGWASFIEGASNAEWQSFFAGSIDEIRFYNKVLSEAELQALRKEELTISLSE